MKKDQQQFIKALGRRIAAAQKAAKQTDDQHVAAMAGFSAQELREYKAGARTPNAYRLARLAQVLNVTTDQLTGMNEAAVD